MLDDHKVHARFETAADALQGPQPLASVEVMERQKDQTDAPLTSEVLARGMGTNPAVFRRTMAGLREAGLVRSGKGHGGGWQLARPLSQITPLAVYEALGRPNLFAIGIRSEQGQCLVERNVNAVVADTMAEAVALFDKRFGELTLDQIAPSQPVPVSVHANA